MTPDEATTISAERSGGGFKFQMMSITPSTKTAKREATAEAMAARERT